MKIYEQINVKHYKNNDEYDGDDDGDYEKDNENQGYRIWCGGELNNLVKRCDTSC